MRASSRPRRRIFKAIINIHAFNVTTRDRTEIIEFFLLSLFGKAPSIYEERPSCLLSSIDAQSGKAVEFAKVEGSWRINLRDQSLFDRCNLQLEPRLVLVQLVLLITKIRFPRNGIMGENEIRRRVLTWCRVRCRAPLSGTALWRRTRKGNSSLWSGQTGRDGSRGRTCRWCTYCPTRPDLSTLGKSVDQRRAIVVKKNKRVSFSVAEGKLTPC